MTMMRHVLAGVFTTVLLIYLPPLWALAGPAMGPLRVCETNPRYFCDGEGRIVFLTGSHLGWELQDDAWGREFTFDYGAFLDFLEQHNHNLIRMWVVENTKWHDSNPNAIAPPVPYQRTGPDTALDGEPKFNLEQLDRSYFDRLRRRTIAARERGIYVMVMLFQGFSVFKNRHDSNPWFGHPFNKSNNVNGIDGDRNGDGEGHEVHTLAMPAITRLQETYIREVINTVNDLDNVLYEVSNESRADSRDWQYHIIDFIHDYEKTKPNQHPVVMSSHRGGPSNAELFAGPADAVVPRKEKGQAYDRNPPASSGEKVVICDTDHIKGLGFTNPQWVWKCLCRGISPILMDEMTNQEKVDRIVDQVLDPKYNRIRSAMGHARTYANRLSLSSVVPANDVSTTRYCLAEKGTEYFVYQPAANKDFQVTLEPGSYGFEWFDPVQGEVVEQGSINAVAGPNTFKAPFSNEAVLYLMKQPD